MVLALVEANARTLKKIEIMILKIYLSICCFFALAGGIDYTIKQKKFHLKWIVAFALAFFFIWPYAVLKVLFKKRG